MNSEQHLYNAVMNERERIKAIIRRAEEQLIDEPIGEEESQEYREAAIATTRIFVEVFTDIESAIDQNDVSRITISERQGVR